MRWTAARLGSCAPAPPLDSRQLCVGAACRLRHPFVASRLIAVWTAALQGSHVLAPPLDSRRPSAAVRWRRLSTRDSCTLAPPVDRGVRSSSLVSSPSGQRRGKAATCWRHLSTRSGRPSPLVSVAACAAARRGSRAMDSGAARQPRAGAASRLEATVRWRRLSTEASVRRLSSHRRLDSGAARQPRAGAASRLQAAVGSCALAPPLDSRQLYAGAACRPRRPFVVSRLIAFWTAARQSSHVLAPPLYSKRPSVASCLCRRQYSGAARQLCDGQRRG